MRTHLLHIACTAVLLLCAVACSEDCYQSKQSLLGVSFVNAATGRERTVALTEVVGEGSDSVLYSGPASKCFLPLKRLAGQTDYLVSLRDSFFAKAEMVKDTSYVWELDENNDSIQVMVVDSGLVVPVTQCRLTVKHSQVAQYVSPECGCGVAHRLSEVGFGSGSAACAVEILNTNVSHTNGEVHVQISW